MPEAQYAELSKADEYLISDLAAGHGGTSPADVEELRRLKRAANAFAGAMFLKLVGKYLDEHFEGWDGDEDEWPRECRHRLLAHVGECIEAGTAGEGQHEVDIANFAMFHWWVTGARFD